MRWTVWIWVGSLAVGCRAAEAHPDPRQPAAAAAPARGANVPAAVTPAAASPSNGFVPYGAPLAPLPGSERDLAALVANPDDYAGAPVTVSGVVRQVCQRRGCWLELAADSSPDAVGCRVVSEHHAFFVPRDATGSRARVQGKLEVSIIPAAQVAHMESEGGHFSAKQSDGSARELSIVASGVELARSDQH